MFKKTRFTQFLIRENALDKDGFREWVFHPDMLFQATEKWWGDRTKRSTPHEGLDFCLYRNGQNHVASLNVGTKIPAMYGGTVMKIIDDFLGKSVIVERERSAGDGAFLTIYGHTAPVEGLRLGRSIGEGEVIATIAIPKDPRIGVVPHLHLSLALVSETVRYEDLDWKKMSNLVALTMLDPLNLMDNDYIVLKRERPVLTKLECNHQGH
jgi:hypothetical protein